MSLSLTPSQLQSLILAELSDPDAVLAPQLATLWALNEASGRSPFVQYLYTKRSGITLLQGSVRTRVTKSVGDLKRQDSDQMKALSDMYDATNAEIARQEQIARASGGARVGVLTTTAPEAPPDVWGPDRNASTWLGNPYGGRRLP